MIADDVVSLHQMFNEVISCNEETIFKNSPTDIITLKQFKNYCSFDYLDDHRRITRAGTFLQRFSINQIPDFLDHTDSARFSG